jgi:hypothetical protein
VDEVSGAIRPPYCNQVHWPALDGALTEAILGADPLHRPERSGFKRCVPTEAHGVPIATEIDGGIWLRVARWK